MSKGNMLLGHARGKVGDLVFSRTNGQQVVRARAAVVKNPQTQAQMIQRIIMNTVSQAYSKMQPIVDHSFEGIQAGQKTMSEFSRKNLHVLRQKVAAAAADPTVGLSEVRAFTPVGNNGFSVNDFIVSVGSLPSIVPALGSGPSYEATVAIGGNTYQDVINQYGLQRGDQLTFCCITGLNALNARFAYSRIILDPTNPDGSAAPLSSTLVVNGQVNLPSERNTGTFAVLTVSEAGVLSFNSDETRRDIQGCFVIVSRRANDGTWKRSNASVVTSEDSVVAGYSMGDCLDLFAEGGVGTLSDMYLNNAGTGAVASAASNVQGQDFFDVNNENPFRAVAVTSGTYQTAGESPQTVTLLLLQDAQGNKKPLICYDDNSAKVGYYYQYPGAATNLISAPNGITGFEVEDRRVLKSLTTPQADFLVRMGISLSWLNYD